VLWQQKWIDKALIPPVKDLGLGPSQNKWRFFCLLAQPYLRNEMLCGVENIKAPGGG